MMNNAAIYIITNSVTGSLYVGSAVNVAQRWREHKSGLNRRNHRNQKLQRAWDKYGASVFEFSVTETVDDVNSLITKEQFWIDKLNAASHVNYNIDRIAGSRLGSKASPETIAKLVASHTGYIRSKESSAKAAESNRGKKRTPEMRARMAASKKGKPLSEEHRKRIGEVGKGRVVSAETRLKISIGNKGKIISEEQRRKISAAKMGHIVSAETRAKISATKRLRLSTNGV